MLKCSFDCSNLLNYTMGVYSSWRTKWNLWLIDQELLYIFLTILVVLPVPVQFIHTILFQSLVFLKKTDSIIFRTDTVLKKQINKQKM